MTIRSARSSSAILTILEGCPRLDAPARLDPPLAEIVRPRVERLLRPLPLRVIDVLYRRHVQEALPVERSLDQHLKEDDLAVEFLASSTAIVSALAAPSEKSVGCKIFMAVTSTAQERQEVDHLEDSPPGSGTPKLAQAPQLLHAPTGGSERTAPAP